MYSRLIEFFDERKIHYYEQFGFWEDFLTSGNDVEFDIGDTALTVADKAISKKVVPPIPYLFQ